MVILSCSFSLWFCKPVTEQVKNEGDPFLTRTDTVNFKTEVMPLLQRNCSPCHFPGGKLYDKLPFDKGETIISHKGGIMKRIKKEEELELIKKFTSQHKITT